MAEEGVAQEVSPAAAVVLRGEDVASLDVVIEAMLGRVHGSAVVCTRLSPPGHASPAVVHAVVDALVDAGCHQVTVGSSLGPRDRDRGHRSVSGLAHLAGLTRRTPRGAQYEVADLTHDLVPAPVPPTSMLDGHRVSALWAAAELRVVVGRAVTDLLDAYAGCLSTLGAVSEQIPGAETSDVVVDVLRHLPPTLAVVDATITSDGADGGRLLHPTPTGAVVVSTNALLADCALAALLGEDRSCSRLTDRALAALGAPTGRIDGDLGPFEGISRPHPLARTAARAAADDPRLARVLSAAIGGPDDGALPADPVLSSVRSVLTPAVAAATDPVGQMALVGLLGTVAAATRAARAWAAGVDKGRVRRRVVPLGFDPAAHLDEEYDGLADFLSQLDAVLDALPDAEPGAMRWCLVDGATVFEVSRDIPADFDDFVARVDVAEGISLMADYLGGRRVPVGTPDPRAAAGSVMRTRQAERNLYLPQPNYLAVWGGEPIDVCKIELVERTPDAHRLLWRTVHSPNGSATYDDGSLILTRSRNGTRATVRGRQLFTLPPPWSDIDLAALPEVHTPLLEEAYRRFFTTTFDNLEARFEGRELRIGQPPPEPDEPLVTQSLQLLLDAAQDWLRGRTSGNPGATGATGSRGEPGEMDVDGFLHVRGDR